MLYFCKLVKLIHTLFCCDFLAINTLTQPFGLGMLMLYILLWLSILVCVCVCSTILLNFGLYTNTRTVGTIDSSVSVESGIIST